MPESPESIKNSNSILSDYQILVESTRFGKFVCQSGVTNNSMSKGMVHAGRFDLLHSRMRFIN